ncbi:hypothetical protein GXW77_07585 [Roseomonas alkaliterrae]|uniref:Uncharacterized protein n=1 Tax=Neoroseomonas alkaliterrae TaxID=1452450 RepID=A0A840XQP8_9PROT|nr:hypothetical protein [Neoroseomonas alkaliterrae]MBB5690895.1 hypothetical protein [Neoroseomonas alkaliterrae]MBR0676035.1 hypothetical protein [Neoroseomonas alkaliterrae]
MYDMNDAELPRSSDLIPDGTFAKVTMVIRPGGLDGQGEVDRGLLKASRSGGDTKMIDAEFTVLVGPHAKRKFWQNFTVAGGKVDEHGVSIAWKISKGTFRAMIDSALGLDPQDMSEAAKAKRVLRGLADLSGITFAAKIKVEASTNAEYGDQNRLDRVVLPGEPEYARIMAGEVVPPSPSTHRTPRPASAPSAAAPAWASTGVPRAPVTAAPAWAAPSAAPPAPPAAAPPQAPLANGPAWLNG